MINFHSSFFINYPNFMKTSKINLFFLLFISISLITGCGILKNQKISKNEKILTSVAWKHQPFEGISEDSITKIDPEVEKFAYFVAETLTFYTILNEDGRTGFSSKIGEGLLSIETIGFWKFNQDESALIMSNWDEETGEGESRTNKIIELTKEKLVLEDEDGATKIYFPK